MILNPYRKVRLEDWQLLSMRCRSIEIQCLTGAIWVTWPKGKETVLHGGQQVKLNATGKICVQALAGSEVVFQK